MSQDKKMILQMLSEGKINVSETEKLLTSLNDSAEESSIKPYSRKFLRVLITEDESTKVNINIPIALAEAGLKLVPKEKLQIEQHGINIDDILTLVKEGSEGELVNIETTEAGKALTVRVSIE